MTIELMITTFTIITTIITSNVFLSLLLFSSLCCGVVV